MTTAVDCLRSIRFVVPGDATQPDVEIYAYEGEGLNAGKIYFTVTVLNNRGLTGDLRGLFFNFNNKSTLTSLAATGSKVTDFDTVDVIDLGNGANLLGGGRKPFDVGVEFGTQGIGNGDDIQSTSFVLAGSSALTLDDIAKVQFGARVTSTGRIGGLRNGSAKLTSIAPAAPDAKDDEYSIFEDGASGLNDPLASPKGVLFSVLSNDTDADGDTLTIHGFETLPQWGTVQIVDGADADSLVGDAILYTPFADYPTLDLETLADSFVYCISDGNGGTDYATVTIDPITPVADIPEVTWELLTVEVDGVVDVSKINIRVTATQTDDDISEFIDRILATVSGGLPEGVIITPGSFNPGTEPDSYTADFLLTLDPTKDYNFDIVFDAWSKEKGNGDEQIGSSEALSIVFDYNSATEAVTFAADDQSIWGTGDEFEFKDDRFIGLDTGPGSAKFGSTLYAGLDYDIRLGFQSTLVFEGGAIDANATQNITIETAFNRTLDVLQISSSKVLQSASFVTQGPRGTYDLDFIYDLYLKAYAGLSLDFGELGTWNEYTDFGGPIVDAGGSEEILSLTSEDLSLDVGLPAGFSLGFAWPNLSVTDSFPTDSPPLVESGASNNFLQLNLDVDDLAATLLGLPANPFDVGFDIGIVYANLQVLDVDVFAGLNFIQEFTLGLDNITGQLIFEDGTFQAYTIGDDIVINGASQIDQNGGVGFGTQNDGQVEFKFILDQQATLGNDTELGLNVGYNVDVLKGTAGYDVGIDSGSTSFGPVASIGDQADVFSVDIYGSTFGLDFQSQQLLGFA